MKSHSPPLFLLKSHKSIAIGAGLNRMDHCHSNPLSVDVGAALLGDL